MKNLFTKISIVFMASIILSSCKITKIISPNSVGTNQEFTLNIYVEETATDKNEHYGLLGMLIPKDWSLINANYTFKFGNGSFSLSEEWADSIEAVYPSESYCKNYKWIALITDKKYSYSQKIEIETEIKLKSGLIEGCYNLAFLTTKATPNLINSGNYSWAPIVYPTTITVSNQSVKCEPKFTYAKAEDWDSLFNRKFGWTGADGIYSIPFNQDETKNNNTKHLFIFSDTFIGQVDTNGKRINTSLVNNTYAVIQNNEPVQSNIVFKWESSSGKASTFFKPETPNAKEEDWYWLMDGININGHFNVYALRMEKTQNNFWGFKANGVCLIKFNIDESNKLQNVTQFDTPLFFKNDTEKKELDLGQAVMPLTSASKNYDQDGYVYVYGPLNLNNIKYLVCSRVLPENIYDFSKYTFWDGQNWNKDINSAAKITDGISQEFSVTPLENGKFILIFQIGDYVAYKIGDSPVGPFGNMHIVYDCLEKNISNNTIIYNAKAHPSLSDEEGILISYNVNTMSFSENINIADIYRPRFIKLKLNDKSTSVEKEKLNVINTTFVVEQNYPNPFNPNTKITLRVLETENYSIKIYNELGEEIKTLIENRRFTNGVYTVSWNAIDFASGTYFYKVSNSQNQSVKKMILVK